MFLVCLCWKKAQISPKWATIAGFLQSSIFIAVSFEHFPRELYSPSWQWKKSKSKVSHACWNPGSIAIAESSPDQWNISQIYQGLAQSRRVIVQDSISLDIICGEVQHFTISHLNIPTHPLLFTNGAAEHHKNYQFVSWQSIKCPLTV